VGIIEAPEGFDVVEAEKDSRNRIWKNDLFFLRNFLLKYIVSKNK
jgi:hypothetical protein